MHFISFYSEFVQETELARNPGKTQEMPQKQQYRLGSKGIVNINMVETWQHFLAPEIPIFQS